MELAERDFLNKKSKEAQIVTERLYQVNSKLQPTFDLQGTDKEERSKALSQAYLEELMKIGNEEIEKFKKPLPHKEKVYKIATKGINSEDKIMLAKLMKKNTLERTQQKDAIEKIKTRIKKFKTDKKKNQAKIEKNQIEDFKDDLEEDYDDEDERTGLEDLNEEEKEERIKWLWLNLFLKAKGSALVLTTFNQLNHRILEFGTKRGIVEYDNRKDVYPWYILKPNTWFKKIWDVVVMILLVYTASYAPFRMAFITNISTSVFVFETFIDTLFVIDLLVNLFSAYENEEGRMETRFKKIFMNYLKGWLILDLIASFPFQFLDLLGAGTGGGQVNTIRKLARLPRLFRIFRVLRILKLVKIIRKSAFLEKLTMNPGIMRLITTLIIVSILVHVYACLWFLQSKLSDHSPDTWVARYSYQDTEIKIQYLTAVYWSCQLLTTVGYGDFGVGNMTEIIMNIFWMIFGVAFYSFVIGNIQSIITKMDGDTEDLVNKLKALENFKKNTGLKNSVYIRIKKYLEQNYNDLKWTMAFDEFLPESLNDEILSHIYRDTICNITFFNDIPHKNFIWSILQYLQTIKVEFGELIYLERDLAKEMYFLKTGSVKLYYKSRKIAYIEEGDYFGDIEMFYNINREFKARAANDCILLRIHKKNLVKVLDDYPQVKNNLLNTVKEKRERYYDIIIQKKLPMPEKILNVYGVPNLDSEERKILPIEDKSQTVDNKKDSPVGDNKSKKKEIKENSIKNPKSPPKESIKVPEIPQHSGSKTNLQDSQDLSRMDKALAQNLEINKEFSSSMPMQAEVTEKDVVQILENYDKDMELIESITVLSSKIMGKLLSSTNKLYNDCVEVESKNLKVEKEILNMKDCLDDLLKSQKS
ncbi:unnamed protein product [Moneuplotes crassus]|uniref:Cyclic nucleotide-binding domain-containing protein n=1 Tax=Euplotes crassus TaxID=5936 RepID=A0AAD2D0K6_EUPCR|nr:unnamed protein product [Moneuplotes crassus]